mmetsp:Transcript_6069/g.18374  ORF Transcript_6069/g.18374 Transcript_6069/m.18374 type:complete len:266 (-) Transcript_6069:4211-5008(-)
MIPMREHRASHSAMEWDVSTTLLSSLLYMSEMTFHRNLLATGSIPVEGSSSKMTLGSPTTAAATASFLLLPPEYVHESLSAYRGRSSLAMIRSTSSAMYALGIPLTMAYMVSISLPVMFPTTASNCGQYPMKSLAFLASVTMSWPAISACPEEGMISPVSILNVVVLPAPFTPRRPKHSFLPSSKLSESTAVGRNGAYFLYRSLATTSFWLPLWRLWKSTQSFQYWNPKPLRRSQRLYSMARQSPANAAIWMNMKMIGQPVTSRS